MNPLVSDSKTGDIANWYAPTIANSSEYSILQTLFTEVRLLRARLILTPTQCVNGSVLHGEIVVSTNMLQNQANAVIPTGLTDVQNQTHPRRIMTSSVTPQIYVMPVPNALEFAPITADAPTISIPYAGSPGAIRMFGAPFTLDTTYFRVSFQCTWILRGRQ